MRRLLLAIMILPATFDSGESYIEPMWGEAVVDYHLFPKKVVKHQEGATRLLIITEPDWCAPCRRLEPVVADLKKQGYDVHTYSQLQWSRATGKPNNMPTLSQPPAVPTLLFVSPLDNNSVLHYATGYRDLEYITTRLEKVDATPR